MYYIDNYREEAINKLVPYLISFPDIVKLTENSADRYQAIEDVLWKIATNFRLVDSRGVFLDAHAHNEVVELIYTDKARDAFTYGATWSEADWAQGNYNPRVFGTGKFYSQASYLSGVPKNVSEEKLIRAVQEKIIQNNTTGIIEDFIEAMKLHFNATRVQVFEAYPLAITLVLSGDKLELSSSGDKDAIKKCLPACVQLKDFYINDNKFDPFVYRIKSNYAMDSRYPIMLGDTDYVYQYKSVGINLNSTDEEYIIIRNPFSNVNLEQNTPFECITGKISELNNNATILSIPFSLNNESYKISVKIKQISENYFFYLIKEKWDENNSVWVEQISVDTAIKAEIDKDFTILLTINKQGYDFAKLWVFNGVKIFGQTSSQDISWAYNIIQNDPNYKTIQINTEEIPSPLTYDYYAYINTFFDEYNEIKKDFADFTYYAILGGKVDQNGNIIHNKSYKSHYYVTCFGEKNILFNCLTNDNHTIIYTNNTLQSNLTVEQDSYNYKKWHSNGRYLNVKGVGENAGIKYGGSTPIQIGTSSWYGVTYGNNKFVAVGGSGYITTSTDGETWSTPIQIGTSSWHCVIYENNKFIAVGDNGYITTSTDGETWSTPIRIGTSNWFDIAYGNNKFIAVGDNGYITTSTDGETWSTPIRIGTSLWYSITYGNGKFIAVGYNGYITTSTDGETWSTPIQIGTSSWYGITYGNNKFIAVGSSGYITTSTDGETWSTPIQIGTSIWNSVTYENNKFIAVGYNSYIINSTDGETWSTPIRIGTSSWLDIAYGNNKFIAVGGSGYITIYIPINDVIINSFELSMDICFPLYNNIIEDILNGLLGKDYNLKISFRHKSVVSQMRITIPTFTSGNIETPYVINENIPTRYFERHFNNLKLKYKDNIFYVYIDNTLITTEELLNINIKYLNTMLELGPINAFVRNFKFNSVYTENLEEKTLEYDIPLKINLYETNDLLEPNNINARFLTVPQLIDNKTNQDIFNGTTIREF